MRHYQYGYDRRLWIAWNEWYVGLSWQRWTAPTGSAFAFFMVHLGPLSAWWEVYREPKEEP